MCNLAAATPFTAADALLAVELGRNELDEGFLSRWTRTTDRERRYLRAITSFTEDKPRSTAVAQATGTTTSAVSDVRESLIRKGHRLVTRTRPHRIHRAPA